MDSARCIGQAQRELSFRRRNELKSAIPALAPLCSADVPVTEFLFGDKLEEDLKAAQVAAKLVVKPPFVSRASNRYQPYTKPRGGSLNGRGACVEDRAGPKPQDSFVVGSNHNNSSSVVLSSNEFCKFLCWTT